MRRSLRWGCWTDCTTQKLGRPSHHGWGGALLQDFDLVEPLHKKRERFAPLRINGVPREPGNSKRVSRSKRALQPPSAYEMDCSTCLFLACRVSWASTSRPFGPICDSSRLQWHTGNMSSVSTGWWRARRRLYQIASEFLASSATVFLISSCCLLPSYFCAGAFFFFFIELIAEATVASPTTLPLTCTVARIFTPYARLGVVWFFAAMYFRVCIPATAHHPTIR